MMEVLRVIEGDPLLKRPSKTGFWPRQFIDQVTRRQIVFDVVFGIAGPIACFAFDPIVFRGDLFGAPMYPEYRLYVYFFSGLQIVMLSLWLIGRAGIQFWNEVAGSGLFLGGVFCIAIGLAILPYSLMGVMFGIGIFGFTPFLTGFVYLRNGVRALRSPRTDTSVFTRAVISLLSSLVLVGLPLGLGFGIHQAVESSIEEIVHGDASHGTAAAHRLGPLKYFVGAESEKIVMAYRNTSDPLRKEFLKNCYREITGDNIETRIQVVRD